MTLNAADPYAIDHTAAVLQKMAERRTLDPAQDEQLEQAAKRAKRFILALAAAIINAPQQADAIKGVIPSSGIVVIYGPSGSGKSFLALYMAYILGHGLIFFGFKGQSKFVVYINLEGSMRTRLDALQTDKKRDIPDNVRFVTEPFHILEDVESLAADIPEGAVIFIDTLNAAAPGLDENSSRDMGLILEAAKKLQRLTGGLVVLVHHSGKDASKGLRGHSSLYAAMDAVIEVGRNGDSRYWRLAKSKEGRDGIRRGFRLKSVGLGYDEDGEPITSCVVEEDNTALQEEAKPLTPALRYALETLEAVLDRYKRYTVTLEQWREEFYARHTADNLNAKKVAFRRARMELQNIGKLSVINDEYGIIGRIQDDTVPVQAGTLPVQQQILYRTPDHAGIGTDGTHSFRSVPLVPSSEGPEYE